MLDPESAEAGVALEQSLLADFAAVFSLNIAFQRGLMARLLRGPIAEDDPDAAPILMELLQSAKVIEPLRQGWQLRAEVADLLETRAASLQAKVSFTALAAADLLAGGEQMIFAPEAFARAASTFQFFCYHRARDTRAASLQDTAPWLEYVTALSEAEAPRLAPHLPLDGVTRLLEIGGNSGAFALALLERHPSLQISIMDLPAVCHLGQAYVASRPDATRLVFHAGDARVDPLPRVRGAPPEVILFKSMLHDWTEKAQRALLARAADHLAPQGRLMICERAPMGAGERPSGLGLAPHLVFASYYRKAEHYRLLLADLGFALMAPVEVEVDLTFQILIAERRG
jgi:hypothetical protein